MAAYRHKIGYALDEDRILVLGTQVFVGFQFQWAFQPGFSGLPQHCQDLSIIALGLMLVALGLLIAPCGYHRIADDGYDTRKSYHYTVTLLLLALWPFALGLGAALYIAVQKILDGGAAIAVGIVGTLFALLLWLGLPL